MIHSITVNALTFYIILYSCLFAFIFVSAIISVIKYKKMIRNKTVGIHNKLYKAKFDLTCKVSNLNIGYHIYLDKAKQKWAIVCDNPKYCDIYSYSSFEDYALTLNGEITVRSSMKSVISELKGKRCSNITLDIFTNVKNYRIVFLNHEEKMNDNTFLNPYKSANEFCDLLENLIS